MRHIPDITVPSDEEYPLRVAHETPKMHRVRQIVTAAVLAAAIICVSCLFSGGARGASAAGSIVINEVVSSNCASLTAPNGGSPDWIELYNRSDCDVSLQGYAVIRGTDTASRHTLGDVTIPAGGYLILYATDRVQDDAPCTGFSLSRDGESLCLLDSSADVVDSVTIPALYTDISYARRENGGFGCCLHPTPGAANSQTEEFSYYVSLAQQANIVITEVMPEPLSGSAWIELYNAGETEASLGVFYLADDEADTSPNRLPDMTLGAGQYTLVYTGETADGLCVSFSFGADDHGAYLYDVTGAMRSAFTWDIFPGSGASVVAADTFTRQPTPGAANSTDVFRLDSRAVMDDTDPVRISEALVSNTYSIADAEGEQSAWAEVCNLSDEAVPLSGYYLSDDADSPLKWAFPDMTLQPHGYAVVFLSGKTEITSELHASFGADEGALYLTDTASMRTDTFALPPEQADNVSVGRTEGSETCYYANPSPGAANAEGFSTLSAALESRSKGVYISEVCAVGDEADWIELYNGSDEAVDLSGWYLSDNTDDPQKWQIPSLTIEAGGYAVVELDGVSDATAPFGIVVSGETVVLTDSNGALIDAMETGLLRAGLTSGRAAGDTQLARVFFLEHTPGAPNSEQTSSGYAAAPLFPATGLYHTEAFSLEITAAADALVYYTLDGSMPDDTDTLCTGPITISGNTVVRAVAYAPGLMPSDVTTATYLFEEPHTIPVVCLSGEPSEMNYIFNEADRHDKPEYGGNMEYYETDGTLGICFDTGIKSKGRSSLEYGQKSVTICLSEEYGRSEVSYPFFEENGAITFTELTLRNGGQDYFGSRLRDSFVQQLAQGMDVDGIRTRPVAVYVNGEYWGLYDLEEEQEEGYFEAYYGLSYDDIDMIDRNNTVKQGSVDDFLAVRSAARNWDLGDDTVFAQFSDLVDVEACMNYLIVNTYFGNGDVMNQRFWHAQDGSVAWRPLLFDLDWCMRFNSAYRDTFSRYFNHEGSAAGNGTITNMDIFCGLKKNAAWREAFIDRFIEMAYTNFDTDRVLALFDDTVAQMEPEMARHTARWHTHRSVDAWLYQTDLLRSALEKRRDIALRDMADAFGLSNEELQARIEDYTSTH